MAYPYANIDDVFGRFPIHTLVGTGSNEVTSIEVSSVYIKDAQAIVDIFLGNRYVVPLTADPFVTMITADLAIFHMLSERSGRVPQAMQSRYDRTMSYLEGLRDGDMVLDPASQSYVSSGDQFAWSTTGSYHPTFSPVLDPLDQKVDATWIDDEKDTREDDT